MVYIVIFIWKVWDLSEMHCCYKLPILCQLSLPRHKHKKMMLCGTFAQFVMRRVRPMLNHINMINGRLGHVHP